MYNLSRQAKIDKIMCKPGYTWTEMSWHKSGGKCLPAGGYGDYTPEKPSKPSNPPSIPEQPAQPQKPPEQAIMEEKVKRAAAVKPVK